MNYQPMIFAYFTHHIFPDLVIDLTNQQFCKDFDMPTHLRFQRGHEPGYLLIKIFIFSELTIPEKYPYEFNQNHIDMNF